MNKLQSKLITVFRYSILTVICVFGLIAINGSDSDAFPFELLEGGSIPWYYPKPPYEGLREAHSISEIDPVTIIPTAPPAPFLVPVYHLLLSEPKEQLTTVLTQFTNPDDRLMLTADTKSGEKIAYYGTKNVSGETMTLDTVRYQTSEQMNTGTATWLHFNNNGQLRRIEGESGTVISVDQVNEFEYALSTVSGDGKIQVNTIVELDATTASNQRAVQTQHEGLTENDWLAEKGDLFTGNHDKQVFLREEIAQNSVETSGSGKKVYAHASVFECGNYEGVDGAYVYVTASKPGDPYPDPFLAVEEGNGRYKASIPLGKEPLTTEAVTNACKSIANVLGVSCTSTESMRGGPDKKDLFCTSIAAGVDWLLYGPTGEGALILAECIAGYEAMEAYCATLGSTPSGAPGPTDDFCDLIGKVYYGSPGVQQAIDENQLEVQAYAKLPGRGTKTSDPVILNPFTDELPSFLIDFGGDIAIDEISFSPTVPCKGESYSVTVKLSCSEESEVTIEVSREDGTKPRHEFSPTDDEPITIPVPGSSSGRDVIRVLAVSPEMGPFGFITASKDVLVELQDCGDDATNKWKLDGSVLVNPYNQSLEYPSQVPSFFIKAWPGQASSYYSVNQNEMTANYYMKDTEDNIVYYDVDLTAKFGAPPSVLVPGEIVSLTVNLSKGTNEPSPEAFASEGTWYEGGLVWGFQELHIPYSSTPGISFWYSISNTSFLTPLENVADSELMTLDEFMKSCGSLEECQKGPSWVPKALSFEYFPWASNPNVPLSSKATYRFKVPEPTKFRSEFWVTASLGHCDGCYVVWNYVPESPIP